MTDRLTHFDAAGNAVEICVGEAPLAIAGEINDREPALVAVAADEVAQIGKQVHAFGGAVK